eukprot:CAMPEP_0119308058 /NCGR_PEP_ID=MMETSP1333-20130426/8382_1 /TAXON_ID=418940 /ORGANISM="Scyphosphaera apsteinii, Strain RCC1455" /LENGTH=290 /DNA_ID=CAMNT_0007311749 /DNA_START=386 /DNA_END=1254 /DNA_ORIENTATION=-
MPHWRQCAAIAGIEAPWLSAPWPVSIVKHTALCLTLLHTDAWRCASATWTQLLRGGRRALQDLKHANHELPHRVVLHQPRVVFTDEWHEQRQLGVVDCREEMMGRLQVEKKPRQAVEGPRLTRPAEGRAQLELAPVGRTAADAITVKCSCLQVRHLEEHKRVEGADGERERHMRQPTAALLPDPESIGKQEENAGRTLLGKRHRGRCADGTACAEHALDADDEGAVQHAEHEQRPVGAPPAAEVRHRLLVLVDLRVCVHVVRDHVRIHPSEGVIAQREIHAERLHAAARP